MPLFHDAVFPEDISRGASGGPMLRTDVVELRSGFEERNSIWKHPRHEYNVGLGLRQLDDVYRLKEFFLARQGKLHAFRFKDWSDYKSCDPQKQPAASDHVQLYADGVSSSFTLQKRYYWREIEDEISLFNNGSSLSFDGYVRTITKPRKDTVLLSRLLYQYRKTLATGFHTYTNAISNTVLVEDTDYVVDYLTGKVSLSTPPAGPSLVGSGVGYEDYQAYAVYAGFEFDVPVRFNTDKLNINVEVFEAGEAPDIALIEIKV